MTPRFPFLNASAMASGTFDSFSTTSARISCSRATAIALRFSASAFALRMSASAWAAMAKLDPDSAPEKDFAARARPIILKRVDRAVEEIRKASLYVCTVRTEL